MPSMANLTVKKADTTTDIVYDAIVSAGGDGVHAVWRQDTGADAGLPVGLRPTFKVSTKWNGPKTARVVNVEYVYPYATDDTTTSRFTSNDRVVVTSNGMTFPQGVPAAVLSEAAHQFANLMATSLMKSVMATGYAPT